MVHTERASGVQNELHEVNSCLLDVSLVSRRMHLDIGLRNTLTRLGRIHLVQL